MIKVGIVGGSGYTGAELLRLLCAHPQAEIQVITSRNEAGKQVAKVFPNLRGRLDLSFVKPEPAKLKQCDLVFFTTPNGVAMMQVPELLSTGVRVIDLSADFRLKDVAVWEKWYGMQHPASNLLTEAVYGLPEISRKKISTARLVANPGCYPTAVQLGLLPLLIADCVDTTSLIADAKSGVTGAGRKAEIKTQFAECADSFKAYNASGHRHLPEIEQGLQSVAKSPLQLTFVPHLTPIQRGIHATLYARLIKETDFQDLFEKHYKNEPFVDVMPFASHPETRSVRAANFCRIAIHHPQERNVLVLLVVIDNLVKGAAGQAVQNMNLMFDMEECLGLNQTPVLP